MLVASHVNPIKTLVRLALGAPASAVHHMQLAPASLSEVRVLPGRYAGAAGVQRRRAPRSSWPSSRVADRAGPASSPSLGSTAMPGVGLGHDRQVGSERAASPAVGRWSGCAGARGGPCRAPSPDGRAIRLPARRTGGGRTAARSPDLPDEDATDIPFVTIDPVGARDLDQAFFLERLGQGYLVRYAIADVSAFVRPGGADRGRGAAPRPDAVRTGCEHPPAPAGDRARGRQPACRIRIVRRWSGPSSSTSTA